MLARSALAGLRIHSQEDAVDLGFLASPRRSRSAMAFVVEADQVERLRAGSSMEEFLSSLADSTRELGRAPISRFRVGAIGLGSSGRVFKGANLEFSGIPLSQTVHAEQFLVANMLQNGESSIRYLVVSATPCGHCRQFLQELRGAADLRVVVVGHKNNEAEYLSKFLPHRFGPHDLLAEDFPLLLEPQEQRLRIVDGRTESGRIINGFSHPKPDESTMQRLEDAALEAANKSYSPYSDCPSGMAILVKSGAVLAGSYCESAAYNPSLPPLQAALVAFVAAGGGEYDEIECALLVEKENAVMQQADISRTVLNNISPGCPFFVRYAKR